MKNTTKNYIAWSLRVLIAFLFLISAVAKMYPSPYFAISTFEVKQLYPMGFSELTAAYFSRVLIGIEFALGILLLQSHFLKRIVIPATLLMLIVFTTHLSIETFVNGGDSGNCGCFGSLLPMTPIEAIIKNVIAILLLGFLLYVLPKKETKGNIWIISTALFAFILMVFMLAPMQPVSQVNEMNTEIITPTIEAETQKKDTTAVDTITLKNEPTPTKIAAPIVIEPTKKASGYASYFPTIDQGKKILSFFVPGCEHCRDAARALHEMKLKDKNFPEMKIIFMNEEAEKIPEFFQFAGAEYPYKIIEIIPFWKVLGNGRDTPGVKYLWNGNDYLYFDGIGENQFNAAALDKMVKKPYSELKK